MLYLCIVIRACSSVYLFIYIYFVFLLEMASPEVSLTKLLLDRSLTNVLHECTIQLLL